MSIKLAWKEYGEELEDLERIAFGAQGIKLPPKTLPTRTSKLTLAERWEEQKQAHNKAFAASNRAKARNRRVAGAPTAESDSVKP